MYKHFFKRVIDFTIVLVALLVIWPVLLVITIWLHFANKGAGAFFTQERPGKDGKIFKVIKFKSMTDERDADGNLLPDAQRLTKVGSFVRKTSIDELPQLINVLKGDMALIGPRPLTPIYLQLFDDFQKRRMEVRPGITGWAQVNGYRGDTSIRRRIECDLYYIENWTLGLDFKIIFLTYFGLIFINKREEDMTTEFAFLLSMYIIVISYTNLKKNVEQSRKKSFQQWKFFRIVMKHVQKHSKRI